MKRLALFTAFIFVMLITIPARTTARADTLRYAVAPDSGVWFYTSESEDARLFLLPDTYYVRVLHEGEVYSAVEYLVNDPPYKKIMGYCRTETLLFVDFVPARPFLRRLVTVTYTLAGGNDILGDPDFTQVEKTFVYYGSRYESGQLYFYVLEGDKYGFIPAETPLDYERNDDFLTVSAPPVSGNDVLSSGPSAWQTVLICLVAAAAVLIALLVLRKTNPPPLDETPGDF